MKLQEIRNATVKVTYAGVTFLVDPWLASRGMNGAFGMGIAGFCADENSQNIVNPMCELPIPKEEILKDVDVNIITHLHFDHIDFEEDGTVGASLNKDIPSVTQNEDESEVLKRSGFKNIINLQEKSFEYRGISVTKTSCKHGFVKSCRNAMGIVLQKPNEPTLYLAGDTIWYEDVSNTIKTYHPDIIILNCCGANLLEFGRLIMNEEDLYLVSQEAKTAKLVAVHMDTVSHMTISRKELRRRVDSYEIGERVFIPEDGEILEF